VNGAYPAIPALQGGLKGYNIMETPCREATPFRAESFNVLISKALGCKGGYTYEKNYEELDGCDIDPVSLSCYRCGCK
jgi:hypothetical protein